MDLKEVKTFVEFLQSLYSRKLLVFIVSTVLLIFKIIDQNTWLYIGIGYMGANVVSSALDGYKSVKAKLVSDKIPPVAKKEQKLLIEEKKEGEV